MAINPLNNAAFKAYGAAVADQQKKMQSIAAKMPGQQKPAENDFTAAVKGSLTKVNDMTQQKKAMVEDFAAGKESNVHELMITLQKTSVAMNMTTAVRNKLMESYQKIMQMPV